MKEYFTTREAAEYIGYSLSSLRQWRRTGDGPKFIARSSHKRLYRKADLDEFILKNGVQSRLGERPTPILKPSQVRETQERGPSTRSPEKVTEHEIMRKRIIE
jgi:hypothetical protein